MGIIYCWTNTITNKQYIGQTIDPAHRQNVHKHMALKRLSDFYFHRSIRKYGLDVFKYEVLEEVADPRELSKREAFHIQTKNTLWPNGYNEILPTHPITEAMRKKMSDGIKRAWQAKTPSERARLTLKRTQAQKGFKQTEYQKETVRRALSKEWMVTFPDGHQEQITNLTAFARQHSDNPRSMQSNLCKYGKHKGFRAEKVTKSPNSP